jgi:hypothetical protein
MGIILRRARSSSQLFFSDRLASGSLGRKATELFRLLGAELREHAPAAFDVCIDQTCGEPLALRTGG